MRIAFCVPNIVSYASFLSELGDFLISQGHEVHLLADTKTLFSPDLAKGKPAGVTRTWPIPFPRGANLLSHMKASGALKRAVSEIKPDLYHAHFPSAVFTTALARRSIPCKAFATAHGLIFPMCGGLRRHLMRSAESFAYRRMDLVWVLTNDDFVALQRIVPTAKARVHASFGIGCRLDLFDRQKWSASDIRNKRREKGISDGDVVIAFVGRRTHFKGFHLAVRAFRQLLAEGIPAKLLLVGGVDSLHATGLVEEELTWLKNCPSVVDAGWSNDVANLLVMSDLMVFPSTREGVPVNLMESLALGIPVVTINSRGCREVVRHEIDGFVVPKPDGEAVVAALRQLASDPIQRRQFSEEAVAGRSRFDRYKWINEQVAIYREFQPMTNRDDLARTN